MKVIRNDGTDRPIVGQEISYYGEAVQDPKEAEVILVVTKPFCKEDLSSYPNAKLIQVFAAGYDHVDIKAARERGIDVANAGGYGAYPVTQVAFSLLLEAATQVGFHDRRIREGAWQKKFYQEIRTWSLYKKTMGIYGYGAIGKRMGEIAKAFGMNVLAYSRSGSTEVVDNQLKRCSIDELLEKSDVISLHAPHNDESHHFIRKENLAKMKDGVIIVNTARGGLVNEEDLLDALNCGKVRYACLDVLEEEPIREDHPFKEHDRVVMTGHMGGNSDSAAELIAENCRESIASYERGEKINIVN